MRTPIIRWLKAGTAVAVGALLLGLPAAAQEISFDSELPRTLVFIEEEGTWSGRFP